MKFTCPHLLQYGAQGPSKSILSLWPQLLTTLISVLTSQPEGLGKVGEEWPGVD